MVQIGLFTQVDAKLKCLDDRLMRAKVKCVVKQAESVLPFKKQMAKLEAKHKYKR